LDDRDGTELEPDELELSSSELLLVDGGDSSPLSSPDSEDEELEPEEGEPRGPLGPAVVSR
jgi:hypothetical protein